MADCAARLVVRRRRAREAELLNGELAFIDELQFDGVLLGMRTCQGDRTGNLTVRIMSEHDREDTQNQGLPHATEDITRALQVHSSNNPRYPVKYFARGAKIGVNYIIYAMTH